MVYVYGQVARKSCCPKSCCPKPESCCPKFPGVLPEIHGHDSGFGQHDFGQDDFRATWPVTWDIQQLVLTDSGWKWESLSKNEVDDSKNVTWKCDFFNRFPFIPSYCASKMRFYSDGIYLFDLHENSRESVTWSEMGKQNVQLKRSIKLVRAVWGKEEN